MVTKHRVVVTGLGIVSSAGIGHSQFWEGMTSGQSFVRRITRFDPSRMRVQIASEIDDALLQPHLSGAVPPVENRIYTYSEIAAHLAWQDSGITIEELGTCKAGVVVGTSVGPSVNAAVSYMHVHNTNGEQRKEIARENVWSHGFPAELGRRLNCKLRLGGFSAVVSTGCASGADAIGVGLEAIQWGHSNVMFIMGAEAPIEPLTINAFDAIGALSRRNNDPKRASRPFDRDRDGFVLGEGAGVIVLEELAFALRRKARIYGEIRSYVTTTDAHHMTAPRHDLNKSALAVKRVLTQAAVAPEQVDYVSAHATSTPLGDMIETKLAKRIFGQRAYEIPMSSTKSIIGHQSGGSGVFQAISNFLTLKNQYLIPTVNLESRSHDCDLDYVPGRGRPAKVEHILQHTFGFSGKNSMLVMSKLSA
jgi:3-oxoacyl-[acyl-carrier-protein] synthase II